jgi:chromosome segregation ATPase
MAQKNTSLKKQVNDAIRVLNSRGEPVTNQTVRDAIGGGSFRDIGPLVKAVKAELAAQDQAARAAPEMPEDFHDAAAAMWQAAWELADEIAVSERRAHAAEIDKLKAEAEEALSNCGIVEDERDTAEARLKTVSNMLEESNEAFQKAQLEIATLNGRLMERETDIVSRTKQPKSRRLPAMSDTEQPVSSARTGDEAQPDMFPQGEAKKHKPDDPEAIAAE